MGDYTAFPLTTYVRPETASNFKRRARSLGLTSSAYLKQLVEREISAPGGDQMAILGRQITFVAVALDALLDTHPDKTLRPRVYQAVQRKLNPQEAADDL
ncbi:MAG TPA: hypothetical protein VIG90_17195 [Pedomonas sp.]|uniref:hypothetical protein n=1 Tax=Pedomonas sp. TaxID=2976421 RepID=UPI002F42F494